MGSDDAFQVEEWALADLKPHPLNYRHHPEDQLEHLAQSLDEHGTYRNIVITPDGTILAGHGVVQAAEMLGWDSIPVHVMDLDPHSPKALKVLTGDNELMRFAETNDRALSELLKRIKEEDDTGLAGTGYDDMMLANLALVTRPASEVKDFNAAAHWAGMPDYEPDDTKTLKVVVSLRSEEDRRDFFTLLGVTNYTDKTLSTWWPPQERDDAASVRFVDE